MREESLVENETYTGGHRAKQRDALCERSKRVGGREREKGRERTVHARRIMA